MSVKTPRPALRCPTAPGPRLEGCENKLFVLLGVMNASRFQVSAAPLPTALATSGASAPGSMITRSIRRRPFRPPPEPLSIVAPRALLDHAKRLRRLRVNRRLKLVKDQPLKRDTANSCSHPPTLGVVAGIGVGRPWAPSRIAANIFGEGQRQRIAKIGREPDPLADINFLLEQQA